MEIKNLKLTGIAMLSILLLMASCGKKEQLNQLTGGAITTFEGCKEAQYPVTISYPAKCNIDGKVFVLSKTGILTTYYKGKKETEANTQLIVDSNSQLQTTNDGQYLYLTNKALGRIYLIDKTSGALAKSYKLGNAHPILDSQVTPDGSLMYIWTDDSKVWQISLN